MIKIFEKLQQRKIVYDFIFTYWKFLLRILLIFVNFNIFLQIYIVHEYWISKLSLK